MIDRRTFLAGLGASLVAGCAPSKPLGVQESTDVPAPGWKVGQHWVYKRSDEFTQTSRGTLTRSVASVLPGRYELLTLTEDRVMLDDAVFSAPGIELSGTLSDGGPVAGNFESPWRRYDFPLVTGKSWRDTFYVNRTDGQGINRNYVQVTTRVEGWEDVNAGGRTYRAIILSRNWDLGPMSFTNGNLFRTETEWYAPSIGAMVRWKTDEQYNYRPDAMSGGLVHGNRFLYLLESTNVA